MSRGRRRPATGDGGLPEGRRRLARRLRLAAIGCAVAAAPLVLVAALASSTLDLERRTGVAWMVPALLLWPLGWLLEMTRVLLRHRWLRTRRSRSDLAGFVMITGLLLVVPALIFVAFGVAEGYPAVATVSAVVAVVSAVVAWREARHHRPRRTRGGEGDITAMINHITS